MNSIATAATYSLRILTYSWLLVAFVHILLLVPDESLLSQFVFSLSSACVLLSGCAHWFHRQGGTALRNNFVRFMTLCFLSAHSYGMFVVLSEIAERASVQRKDWILCALCIQSISIAVVMASSVASALQTQSLGNQIVPRNSIESDSGSDPKTG